MRRPWLVGLGLSGMLVVTIGAAVSVGSTATAWTDVYRVLAHRLLGLGVPPDPTLDRIVWRLRLPRAVLACVVGGGLSIIGVAMQTLVRNPLAEPYILGISSGASAGASLFYLGFVPPLLSKAFSMPVAAFVGGLISISIAVGLGTMLVLARPLDAMLVGEEPAQSLGMPVEALKRGLIVLATLVTGALVAVSGAIGFVGLIVPHAVRLLVGVPHRRLVPLSFAGGAIFLCWADLAARTLLPGQELPVGILTALCGVPFFLFLLRQRAYQFGGVNREA
ncbi:MAG: ABC transporter permease [Bacteroidetes bacterium QH_2_64_26]|nr:MAG: ABC transporter permease [Bacteroidetes bacterium QH_2_64_26]